MEIKHDISIKDIPEYARILKTQREKLGLTQTQIAKQMDISAMQLSHFETGARIPRLDVFDTWCHLVGLEVCFELKSLE
jgi:transcriptional regulator with XRE-family HTH domain